MYTKKVCSDNHIFVKVEIVYLVKIFHIYSYIQIQNNGSFAGVIILTRIELSGY